MLEILFWTLLSTLIAFYLGYYGLMIYYAQKPNNIQKRRIYPPVSLIIPTYNEETTIPRKLKNVETLDYPKDKLQMIIVDSGSTDNTRKIAQEYKQNSGQLKVQLLTQANRQGKANALNYGWQFCNGEVIIISDSDSLLEKDAVIQIVANFADPTIGAATGRQILLNPNQTTTTKIEQSYRNIYETIRIGESRLDSTSIFHGELSAFRRNLIEGISPDSVADDTELALRIRRKGYRTIYDPEAKFYEYAPPTIKARVRQKHRRGVGLIQQFTRFRGMMFNQKYGKYGAIILPSEYFMHAISPTLLAILALLFMVIVISNPTYLMPILIAGSAALIGVVTLTVTSRNKSNPLTAIATFINNQIVLLVSLLAILTGKTSHNWVKIEDIRNLWKTSIQ